MNRFRNKSSKTRTQETSSRIKGMQAKPRSKKFESGPGHQQNTLCHYLLKPPTLSGVPGSLRPVSFHCQVFEQAPTACVALSPALAAQLILRRWQEVMLPGSPRLSRLVRHTPHCLRAIWNHWRDRPARFMLRDVDGAAQVEDSHALSEVLLSLGLSK